MLYGVSIGPGDPELLTVRAVRVIREADEVIAPGELAAKVIREIREPRIVEFPMGKSEEVIENLSRELAGRCRSEDIAFVALGDVMFYSTFMHVARRVHEIDSGVKIECIPGVASFSCVFDVSLTFCDRPFGVVTARDLKKMGDCSIFHYLVVMKATRPKEIEETAKKLGYRVRAVARRMFMEGQEVHTETPDFEDYFTTMILERMDGGR